MQFQFPAPLPQHKAGYQAQVKGDVKGDFKGDVKVKSNKSLFLLRVDQRGLASFGEGVP